MLLEKTKESPFIYLSAEHCKFEIKGSSFSEYINEIYDDVLKWMDDNIPEMKCTLHCEFHFHVVSSVSRKKILQVFIKLSEFYRKGNKFEIIWYVDKGDEDVLDLSEEITELLHIPMKIIEV
ncbi:MAG: DUF1987 domain-containing protein [Bacteroidales bacterium]|nr:DUF1987 domain-containing protein [Bacteroidales bacterium]